MRSRLLAGLTVTAAVLALATGAVVALGATSGDDQSNGKRQVAQATDTPKAAAKPWIGVVVRSADSGTGVLIEKVLPDGPAAKAGLAEGDVITAVDGTAVKSQEDLKTAIAGHAAGDEVTLSVTKKDSGNSQDVKVTLAERPTKDGLFPGFGEEFGKQFDRFLGGSFKYLDDNGKTVQIEAVPGKVTSKSDTEIKIDVNGDEGERSFSITSDTKVPDGLAVGDRAVVVLQDGAVKAVAGGMFPLMPFGPGGFFGHDGVLPKICERGHGLLPGLDRACPSPPPANVPEPSPQA